VLLGQVARGEDEPVFASSRKRRHAFSILVVDVRAVLAQELDDVHVVVFAARVVEGRVAVVVGLVDRGVVLDQEADKVDVAVLARNVEWGGALSIGAVDVCAVLEYLGRCRATFKWPSWHATKRSVRLPCAA